MVMFERNPSGGYLTNGNDRDGLITSVVPGGKASRPSDVIQSIRFCRECDFSEMTVGSCVHWEMRRYIAIRKHD